MKRPLPIVNGVAPSYLWLPPGEWPSMQQFLEQRFPDVSPATWIERMRKGEVMTQDGERLAPDDPYRPNLRIFYYRELEGEPPVPFEADILYRDEHILVADKPHFLPVVPAGRFLHETLLIRLKKQLGLDDLVAIHRIDRDTAGLVIFSHNRASRGDYQSMFHQRTIAKRYEALAPASPDLTFPLVRRSLLVAAEPFFRMQEIDGEPNSETIVDVLERRGDLALYDLRPISGRKHQLRVHMAGLGLPIVNDPFYPYLRQIGEDDFRSPLKLLARAVSFLDPLTGEQRNFESRRSL